MSIARIVIRQISKVSICAVILLASGCYAGYFANHAAGGDTEVATGEQHDVPYNAHDAFLLTQDVLRGEGVLFEIQPDDKLVTLWRDADTPPSGGTPNEGGVNYAILPNEDLKALARRATGSEDNWQVIAQDNGLKSPSDAAGLPSVWIRNSLLSKKGARSSD